MAEFIFPNIDAGATGKHVYYLLHSRGYEVRDVARILGFSNPQAVYNWKYGSRMPSIDNLDRLSRLLNISINDLLVHDGDEEADAFSGAEKIRVCFRGCLPDQCFSAGAVFNTRLIEPRHGVSYNPERNKIFLLQTGRYRK